MTAVFDGHNDALGRLQEEGEDPARFLTGLPDRQLDLPRARAGGLAGGLFSIFTPSPDAELDADGASWSTGLPEPVEHAEAAVFTLGALGRAHALAAASDGAVRILRTGADLDRCRQEGALGIALHLEGAEAVDPELVALEAWHAAGVRSIGPVWSRPNAFAHGVPFAFPASPDTGPGLTDAGRALVRRCAELHIAIDVSHLNAAGFADIARLGVAPIIASHSACHSLCASTRNLTDDQLRAIAASDGIVGIVYATLFVRPDGREDSDVPLSVLVDHVRHAVEIAGIDHVGLGSDFDGASMPDDLSDVAALPALLHALADAGFTAEEIERIAWRNWRRVLGTVWGG